MPAYRTRLALVAVAMIIGADAATATAQSGEHQFYRAYYLDHGAHDPSGARDLYEKSLKDAKLDDALRDVARVRLAACREDVASENLAALMPPDTFAYVEIGPIGSQVKSLLRQLGVLHEGDITARKADSIAVSGDLVDHLLNIKGAAIAINRIDPAREDASGIAVIHPGDVDAIRGAIETILPAGGVAEAPVRGFPTYNVEGEVLVTLTNRLVLVSPEREQIELAIDRLNGKSNKSLADNEQIEVINDVRGKALVSFFVDTTPIMPMIDGMLTQHAAKDRDLAMANALLDFRNFKTLSGHVGISDDDVSAVVELRLGENHHNLVYNLLRTHPIEEATVRSVPKDAAAFVVAGLNGLVSRYPEHNLGGEDDGEIVTGLDLGREIFANIAGVAVYVLTPAAGGGPGMPDVAAAVTVNDPTKTEAIWRQALGLACLASGAPTPEGRQHEIEGVAVRSYALENGFEVSFATVGHTAIVAMTDSAMKRSIQTQQGGPAINDDPQFSRLLKNLDPDTTKCVMVHPARAIEIARPFMGRDYEEVKPFVAHMSDTVAAFTINHSDQRFRLAVNVTGIPEIGSLISEMVSKEKARGATGRQLRHAMARQQWDEALAIVEQRRERQPDDTEMLRARFDILVAKDRNDEAREAGKQLEQALHPHATALNNFAWALLTEERYENKYDDLALACARRACELEGDNWRFVDTLALAEFNSGDAGRAADLQQRAIELAGDGANKELYASLEKFQAKR